MFRETLDKGRYEHHGFDEEGSKKRAANTTSG